MIRDIVSFFSIRIDSRGNLPWQIYGNSNEFEQVLEIKASISTEVVFCEHRLKSVFA